MDWRVIWEAAKNADPLTLAVVAMGAVLGGALTPLVLRKLGVQEIHLWGFKLALNKSPSDGAPSKNNTNIKQHSESKKDIDLQKSEVVLSASAANDCDRQVINPSDIKEFIKKEMSSHPNMFTVPYCCVPIPYKSLVILFSWNGEHVSVERVLPPNEAYPEVETWARAVASYRRASDLRYRRSRDGVALTPDVSQAIKVYEGLVFNLSKLPLFEIHIPHLTSLVHDAEYSLDQGDIPQAIMYMEVILSSAHKILQQYVPGKKYSAPVQSIVNDQKENSNGGMILSILIVEDDRSICEGIGILIESLGNVNITYCMTMRAALEVVVDKKFDLVFLDYYLPEVTGLYLYKYLLEAGMKSPAIIITGDTSKKVDEEAKEYPLIKAVLRKPLSLQDFFRTIGDVLGPEEIEKRRRNSNGK